MNELSIENTSKEHYLTGMTALNIPMEDGRVADWHFTSALLNKNRILKIAGQNIAESNDLFGDYGIRECSEVLKKRGLEIKEGVKVYSANFVRAILDLIYNSVQNNIVPKHIEIDEFLEDEKDRVEFNKQFQLLKFKLKNKAEFILLNQWENETQSF